MASTYDTHNSGFLFTFTKYGNEEGDWDDGNNELGFGWIVVACRTLDTSTEMAKEWLAKKYPNPKCSKGTLSSTEPPKKVLVKKGIDIEGFATSRHSWADSNSIAAMKFLEKTGTMFD